MERHDKELDNSTGICEGGQAESKSELYSCQKRGKAPVSWQIYKVAIRLRLRFWCLYLQLSFDGQTVNPQYSPLYGGIGMRETVKPEQQHKYWRSRPVTNPTPRAELSTPHEQR